MKDFKEKILFGYWGVRGRGQIARYLLEYTGLRYDERKYTNPAEWF